MKTGDVRIPVVKDEPGLSEKYVGILKRGGDTLVSLIVVRKQDESIGKTG